MTGGSSHPAPKPFVEQVSSVLLLADGFKHGAERLAAEIEPFLKERGLAVQVSTQSREFCANRAERARAGEAQGTAPDLVIVIGGDGAMIGAVRAFAEDPVPVLGIKFGRLGFLASCEESDWRQTVEEVLDGRALVEPRMRLAARWTDVDGRERSGVSLNEVFLTRGAHQSILTIALRVGPNFVTEYRCDGLIVATPSGSTAHSLGAGGPIMLPSMHGMVVTPVCPQSLSHRAIVLDGSEELCLRVVASAGISTLVIDGQAFAPIGEGIDVRVQRHPLPFPLLRGASLDPFRRLRDRLGWRGTIEPGD